MFILGQIITHTPVYVWLLLAYVAWQGIAALRPRTTSLARAFALPAAFIVAGVAALALGPSARPGVPAAWVGGAALLAPLGFVTGPEILAVDRRAGCITRAGSRLPLFRNLFAFLLQYVIAVAVARHGDGTGWLLVASKACSGATAGYFAGWALAVCRRYLTAPSPSR